MKKKKIYTDWKGRSKTVSNYRWYNCVENPVASIKNLLELIDKFSKDAVKNINIQNSIVFLHSSNDQLGIKILKNSTFYNTTQKWNT